MKSGSGDSEYGGVEPEKKKICVFFRARVKKWDAPTRSMNAGSAGQRWSSDALSPRPLSSCLTLRKLQVTGYVISPTWKE